MNLAKPRLPNNPDTIVSRGKNQSVLKQFVYETVSNCKRIDVWNNSLQVRKPSWLITGSWWRNFKQKTDLSNWILIFYIGNSWCFPHQYPTKCHFIQVMVVTQKWNHFGILFRNSTEQLLVYKILNNPLNYCGYLKDGLIKMLRL